MTNNTSGERNVDKMNEFREWREYVRQIRSNAVELDDLVDEMMWVAAGGRGAPQPERVQMLVEATRRMCDDLEDMDIPDAREVRDRAE
jgi:hypothetical protein